MATALDQLLQPTVTPDTDGGVVVTFPDASEFVPPPPPHDANLVEVLSEQVTKRVVLDLLEAIESDIESRAKWERTAEKGLDLLGVELDSAPMGSSKTGPDTTPNARSTVLLEALMQFQANALSVMLPVSGTVVATPTMSQIPPEQADVVEQSRQRAEDFFNWLLAEGLGHYEQEHDQLLFDTGLLGCGFKKVYPSPAEGFGVCVERIPPEDLIVAYSARNFAYGRVTHRTSIDDGEMARRVTIGMYVDPGYKSSEHPEPTSRVGEKRDRLAGQEASLATSDTENLIYECHCDLELEGDDHPAGLPRPYVVTIHKSAQKALAIRRNWKEGDPSEKRIVYFSGYTFLPAKSLVYGFGLAHTLGNSANADQHALKQALQAALLANLPAGFKNANLGIREPDKTWEAGELRDVDAPTGSVADAIYMLPFKGPDPGLMALRQQIVDSAGRVSGAMSLDIAETITQQAPVGTTMAILGEAGAIRSSVHRRLYRGLRTELTLIHRIVTDAMDPQQPLQYAPGKAVMQADLAAVTIEPAMSPGAPSMMHRVTEAQTVMQMAQQFPQLHDMRAVVRQVYSATGISDADKVMVPPPPQAMPADAVSETAMALAGKPLKAGLAQDHGAHIAAHSAAMQMIAMQPALGQPGQAAGGALQAHIAEHVAQDITLKVAMQLGISPEAFAQGIPPPIEARIAPAVAQAMQQILAQMQPPAAPDPLAIEKIKAETTLQKAAMEAESKQQHEAAETQRNTDDNTMALAIAGLKEANRVPPVHPVAPTQNRNPNPGPRT